MKKIIFLLILGLFSTTMFAQNRINKLTDEEIDQLYENDTLIQNVKQIGDSLKVVGENVKEIGSLIKESIKEHGFINFVKLYRYYIITFLIWIFLIMLWARKRKI